MGTGDHNAGGAGQPCDGLASHPGGVAVFLVASCWVPCDGLASHPGGSSNIPSHFMLQKPELSTSLMRLLARLQTLPKQFAAVLTAKSIWWLLSYPGM